MWYEILFIAMLFAVFLIGFFAGYEMGSSHRARFEREKHGKE